MIDDVFIVDSAGRHVMTDTFTKRLQALTIGGLVVAFVILGLTVYASQFYCPVSKPLYSQPGLHLSYKILYHEGNDTFVFYRNVTISSRNATAYDVVYRILDVNGTYSEKPGEIKSINASYHIFRDSALEEFPLTGAFIPMTARMFEVNGERVLAMGYYLPQNGMIIYIELNTGIPVYASLSYGSSNMTYTLIDVEGVNYCHAWKD